MPFAVFGDQASCFHHGPDKELVWECARVATMAALSAATGLITLVVLAFKAARRTLWQRQGRSQLHQLILLGLAEVVCSLAAIRYSYSFSRVVNRRLDNVLAYAMILIPFFVTYFYLKFFATVYKARRSLLRLLNPVAAAIWTAITIVLALSQTSVFHHAAACETYPWLINSVVAFALCFTFFLFSLPVFRALNRMEAAAVRKAVAAWHRRAQQGGDSALAVPTSRQSINNAEAGDFVASSVGEGGPAAPLLPGRRISRSPYSTVSSEASPRSRPLTRTDLPPHIAAAAALIRKKKIKLFSLIVIYLSASTVTLSWSIYAMETVVASPTHPVCHHASTHQAFFLIYVPIHIVSLLVPVWAVLYQFADSSAPPPAVRTARAGTASPATGNLSAVGPSAGDSNAARPRPHPASLSHIKVVVRPLTA
ncbi:uncharacterized protein AMSG_02020 [Thecamonas trahens ATCC 50062]|uniref:Uncharacterized protein n=1 Tax=Thecamonas trahens ATCC 50062 TaxID=461836 RepID=A0A0L0DUY3_THETB|nr:hypothetical protein AMSG_02020 [Thecamonas trahens ATCC 50062]KNC56007.1 hypothetical protein AMSG_02020 [Thecamonas trahens ATCC 50062]|eukprot:XP_013761053.1 hypothetical protein AMSG_02020 [Thecamonas trahens ATCC 50062]